MLESKIKIKIMDYLKTIKDGYFFRVQQGKYSVSGISDIIGIWQGRLCAIEVKVKGNTMTKLQAQFQEKIKNMGGVAICAYDVEDVKKWIK